MVEVSIKQLSHGESLPLPKYETSHSAGMDLLAAINDDIILAMSEKTLIKTGISIELPDGYEAQIRPRSGLSFKYGITVLNSPGTIDADYRGEICVILINLGNADFTIKRGDRIAQMIIAPVSRVNWVEADKLSNTVRGEGGFGSTGV